MTVTSELQAQIDTLRGEVGQLERSIAPAVAAGLRAHSDRPSIEKGAPTIQFGVVDSVFEDDGYANVILDGQTVVTPCMILGAVVEGERVAVIFYPPSGSLIIGMVDPNAQTAGVAISGLPVAATLTGGELVPVVQSGATVQTTAQDIADLGGSGSGFPIGPHDDGVATHEIQVGFPADGVMFVSSAADDSNSFAVYTQIAGYPASGDAAAGWDLDTGSGDAGLLLGMATRSTDGAGFELAGDSPVLGGASFALNFTAGQRAGNAAAYGDLGTLIGLLAAEFLYASEATVGASISMQALLNAAGATVGATVDASGNASVIIGSIGGTPATISLGDPGDLPSTDPHINGQLYMTGYVSGVTPGTVMVSAG